MAQGALPFQYEVESGRMGVTALAGLPAYLELMRTIYGRNRGEGRSVRETEVEAAGIGDRMLESMP